MPKLTFIPFLLFVLLASSGSARRHKNISYIDGGTAYEQKKHLLDVYTPEKSEAKKEVLIFIHGGSFRSGNKNLYKFLGKRLSKMGKVVVIINYQLHPYARITQMIRECAKAVKWVYENIEDYGGLKTKLYVSGHSAGGHLAALLSTQNAWFDSLNIENPIAGCILIDAFALDMYEYLSKREYSPKNTFFKTFSQDKNTWKSRSPIYHISTSTPPTLVYTGAKTYDSILKGGVDYYNKLMELKVKTKYTEIPGKKHIPMMLQLLNRKNSLYADFIQFMEGEWVN